MGSQLFEIAMGTLENYRDDPNRVADEDYIPVPCDPDDRIESFTQRMMKDTELFMRHIAVAAFNEDDFCVEVQARLGTALKFADKPEHLKVADENLGTAIRVQFFKYCEELGNE